MALQRLHTPDSVGRALRRMLPHCSPRTLATLLVDNVDRVQVDWRQHGAKLSQVALLFGASDVDGVPASDEAPLGPRRAPLEEVRRNVTAASLKPVARTGRFEPVAASAN